MNKRHQVIIVGGGPVGVGLAVDLGLRGIDCVMIERRTGLQNIPKGQNLSPRTLEHFYRWGCVDALRAERIMPPGYPISGITAYGSLMSDYWFAPPQREIVRPFYFQDVERLPQYLTEKVLRNKMLSLPGVEARFGWTVEKIEQDAKGVRVHIAEFGGGTGRDVLEADYAVGCDGARSLIREQIGIERGGEDFEQLMVLAVFRSKELHEGLKRFPGRSTYNVLRPENNGYWQFFGRIDVGEGWFFHAPVPSGTTTDNYDFKGLLQNVAGFPFAMELDHVGFWDMRVAVANQYQVGRVFIAGDAAHSHPPYGGFGLNNGLEDVTNVGWKLAAKLKGWGGDNLLSSYSEERHPIFKETGDDFIAGRIAWDKEFLDNHSPERDGAATFEKAWKERESGIGGRLLNYEPNYEASSVVMGPPGGKTTAHGIHSYVAKAGHHLPPQMLSSGKNVFEELGKDFTLLAFDAEAVVPAFEEAARAAQVPLKIVRDSYSGGREAYGSRLILVRPDEYVAWIGNTAPDNLRALFAKVVGKA